MRPPTDVQPRRVRPKALETASLQHHTRTARTARTHARTARSHARTHARTHGKLLQKLFRFLIGGDMMAVPCHRSGWEASRAKHACVGRKHRRAKHVCEQSTHARMPAQAQAYMQPKRKRNETQHMHAQRGEVEHRRVMHVPVGDQHHLVQACRHMDRPCAA